MPRDYSKTHPNSLAALRKHQYKPGQTGNPKGRPALGASIAQWLNRLGEGTEDGRAVFSQEDLEVIAADHGAAPAKRRAAQILLRSSLNDFAKNGRPLAADDLDRIFDRTVGRAAQTVHITREEAPDPERAAEALASFFRAHPELAAVERVDTCPALPDPGTTRQDQSD